MTKQELSEKWNNMLDFLYAGMERIKVENFFRPLTPVKLSEKKETIYFKTPGSNPSVYQTIINNNKAPLSDACVKVFGKPYKFEVVEIEPPEEEEGPITVISFSPTHEPFIDFIDRIDLMKNVALSEVAQEYNSGMFMCYLGNELIADDDRRLLIGPAIMFNCDESGAFIPVSALGFKRTKEFYKRGEETLEVGRVKVPAIRVELVGENVTCVQKKET